MWLHAGGIAKANITTVIGHLLRKQDCRGVHLQVLLDVSAVGLLPPRSVGIATANEIFSGVFSPFPSEKTVFN